MRYSLCILASVLALTGCNTMTERTTQVMHIDSENTTGVNCMLETPKAKYQILTPGKIRVQRAPYKMVITCEKEGYQPTVLNIEPGITAANTFWNIFNGYLPGTAYDIESRSIWDYPEHLVVTMHELPPLPAEVYETNDDVKMPPLKEDLPRTMPVPADMDGAADDSFSEDLRK